MPRILESKSTCLREIKESVGNIRWILDKVGEGKAEKINENLEIIETFVEILSNYSNVND